MNETVDVGNGAPQAGLMVREGFAGNETMQLAELASRAVAEQARAAVESRYVMALKRPRDIDRTRLQILKECRRPGFAAAAIYAKPIGANKVEGFSIRFAEAALRCLTNVYASTETIYDDAEKRIVRVTVTDLEANLTYPKDITLKKQVERSKVRSGQTVLGKRTNTSGQAVYIVEASEDELAMKEAALASKALRQNGLRLIPGDILDEARALITKTLNDDNAKDPDAARKKVLDNFDYYRLGPTELGEFIGKPFAQATPDDLRELVAAYNALREGEVTWAELVDAKATERSPANPAPSSAPANTGSATEKLAGKIKAQKSEPKPNSPEDHGARAQPVESAPPASEQSATAPAPPGEAPAPAAAEEGDELSTEKFAELKAQLEATQAAFVARVGKDRAKMAWQGTAGVQSLRGVKTRKAFDVRLEQGRDLIARADVADEILTARKRLIAQPDGEQKLRAMGQDAMRDALLLETRRAHEVLDVLLTALEIPKTTQTTEEQTDLPWGDKEEAPEPGSNG